MKFKKVLIKEDYEKRPDKFTSGQPMDTVDNAIEEIMHLARKLPWIESVRPQTFSNSPKFKKVYFTVNKDAQNPMDAVRDKNAEEKYKRMLENLIEPVLERNGANGEAIDGKVKFYRAPAWYDQNRTSILTYEVKFYRLGDSEMTYGKAVDDPLSGQTDIITKAMKAVGGTFYRDNRASGDLRIKSIKDVSDVEEILRPILGDAIISIEEINAVYSSRYNGWTSIVIDRVKLAELNREFQASGGLTPEDRDRYAI